MKTRLFPNLRDKQLRNIIYVALPSQINSTRAKKEDIHQGNTSTLPNIFYDDVSIIIGPHQIKLPKKVALRHIFGYCMKGALNGTLIDYSILSYT